MKNFLLFAGDNYYPCGGWRDFHGDFHTVEEAIAAAQLLECDWQHIVDSQTHAVVMSGIGSYGRSPVVWKPA